MKQRTKAAAAAAKLDAPDASVRGAALRTLRDLGAAVPDELVPAIGRLARADPCLGLRRGAEHALLAIGSDAAHTELLRLLIDPSYPEGSALGLASRIASIGIGRAARLVEPLFVATWDADQKRRLIDVVTHARGDDDAAIPLLVDAACEPDEWSSTLAFLRLARLEAGSRVPAGVLAAGLGSSSDLVRGAARDLERTMSPTRRRARHE